MTDSLYQVIQDLFAEMLGNVHTATVARVVKVNEKTLDVQPVINRVVDGESVKLPVFIEVPPVTLQGGGSYVALPVAVDDYCLLIFTERCFDRWYDNEDEQPPAEMRMHDYSDGFAIVGVNPIQAAITLPQILTIQGDSEQFGNFRLDGDLVVTGKITVDGDVSSGGSIDASGNIEATGEVKGADCKTVTGVSLNTHVHPTTAPGANTGAPIPTGG
ncbi:MAG TPA: Gp138 family membrane-puncturing spike protein [Myxococcota bacterium]|nr:Gp138 family membrane-puncturing spike protein [Myxococcota bacterium]